MSKFLQRLMVIGAAILLPLTMNVRAQQLTNANFEDWSGDKFDGNIQPKGWHASNVEQLGYKFNFAHQEAGHNKGYCMMVQDQDVGVGTITETSPGYFSLGQPWVYLKDLFSVSEATAGTAGSINFKYRPDSMVVWIKRTGNNTDKEDFYLLYYSWKGTAVGNQYKGKNGKCTSVTKTDEESDVRLELDGNECGTATKATQVAEGMIRQKKSYNNWTRMVVPIYYFNNEVPDKMNIIFSASNYPNFRANSGLYAGNSLYVDDVELIYSSKVQKLYVGGKEWKAFDPDNTGVQTYSLGQTATSIPAITARRGIGSITNARGKTVPFTGRELTSSEMTISYGDLDSKPTTITVKSEDGKSTTVYQIQFQRAPSTNATLAEVQINGEPLSTFRPGQIKYDIELPYGTTTAPVVTYTLAEDGQTATITQATKPNGGTATIKVTAADKTTTKTYTFNFTVGLLKDVTLKDILVNGKSIPGFSPAQAVYKVSLPTSTTSVPTVEPVSAYAKGEQTIEVTLPTFDNLNGGQAQIRVTAPGTTNEKIYKLNFKIEASSYSYLADLQVVGDQVATVNPSKLEDPTALAFDHELMTYFVNLQMGSTTLPKILWTPGDEFQTITLDTSKVVKGNGTASVSVVAGNKLDQSIYKLVFNTPQSSNTNLADLLIDGKPIHEYEPSITFDPNVLKYEITLGIGVSFPTVSGVKGDQYQTIMEPVVRTTGTTSTTSLTVVAGDGSTKTYVVVFYSQSYTDNRLANLSVEGYSLQNKAGDAVSFDPEVKEYWVKLEMGTTKLPKITAERRSVEYQTIKETYPTNASGDTIIGNYKVEVKPLNGTGRTYTIRFSVEVSSNAALKMLFLEFKDSTIQVPGFDPEKLNYEYMMPAGLTAKPKVLWTKSEDVQDVDTITKKNTTYINVTAGDRLTKRSYSIRFKFPASNNTLLKNLELAYGTDTFKLPGFRRDSLEYTHQLQAPTCPAIIATPEQGQKVAVTAPYADGTATIQVMSEDGSESTTYTIEFTKAIAASVQLDMIYINGAQIPGYDKAQPHYTAQYSGSLPDITYLPADANAKVLWKNTANQTIAYVRVTDGLNEATYDIVFTQVVSENNALLGIYADDVMIDGFKPEQKHYTYNWPAGTAYPTLSYKAAEDAQVVFFGQLADGKWGITVQAASSDTVNYTVQYLPSKFDDATLADLRVTGDLFTYDPAKTEYGPFTIDEGLDLPQVTAVGKPDKNQKIIIFTPNDHEQQVLVIAENGINTTRYIIRYTRATSSIALLKAIYIDGKEMLTFRPDSFHYSIELPADAKVVPNVYPVGQLDNQVITTTFGKPDETTTIVVLAQDGVTSKTYTIDFPRFVSSNTKLKTLTIDGNEQDVNETEYTFNVPFGTLKPYDVTFEKAENEQLTQYISAPITGVTKIIVTAANGDTRTYSIRYNIAQPEGENKITKVYYTYTNAAGESINGELEPVRGNNFVDLPFGSTSFSVTKFDKAYPEQSVVFFNGDIRRGAKLIAVANRQGVNDVTYTITPRMPEFETTGKLQSLTFQGNPVPNFRPDVYNYIVKVTNEPTAEDFLAKDYNNNVVTASFAANYKKTKQVTFSVPGGETYSVCWYYTKYDKLLDFSGDWVAVDHGIGYKPSKAWKVPGDFDDDGGYTWNIPYVVNLTYTTGKEVTPGGQQGVVLNTLRGAPMNTSVPGMMTLGGMSLTLGSSGNSSSSVTKNATVGAEFKNTPEALAFQAKPMSTTNITNWKIWLTMSDGSNYKESNFTGDFGTLTPLNKWTAVSVPISYAGVGIVSKFNVMFSSCDQENAKQFNGSTIYESSVMLDYIHFVYNSELKEAFVNGKATEKSGNTFTYTVLDDENIIGIPALKFTGMVHDQTQTIEWLNNGEWINGKLTAKVTNYGENAEDSTEYFVVLQRTPDESLNYMADFGSLASTTAGDTTFVHMPFASKKFPELTIKPDNDHQRFAVTKVGDEVTVIVTNENNVSDTMLYVFREQISKVATPENIVATDAKDNIVPFVETFDPATTEYTLNAETMPTITVSRSGESEDKALNQTIDLKYTANGAIIKITAEDGVTSKTYTITLVKPSVVTTGKISAFNQGDNEVYPTLKDEYFEQAAKPTVPVLFTRQFASDAVVFIQTPDSMEWRVTGDEAHNYVLKYPTDPSNNANLAKILVAGEPLSGFDPENNALPYIVETDTTLTIEAVLAEVNQTLATELTLIDGGVEFSNTVTAEDGTTKKTYLVQMVRPMSDITTLQAILLDSTLITGFDPEKTDYVITLPIAKGAKKAHVKMPNITYVAGHKGQKIEVTPGELNGEATSIAVSNEIGNDSKTYSVKINEEKSSCTELTGITVNGKSVDPNFEPGRHFYSTSIEKDQIEIDYTCDDRFFQDVTIIVDTIREGHEYHYTLHVTAEDGTQADYLVEIYVENQSNDAQLANILLNGLDFISYKESINQKNPQLKAFDPGQNSYTINVPYDSVPSVSAKLKMDGQKVELNMVSDENAHTHDVYLKVTAVDGITTNEYHLNFKGQLPQEARLSYIVIKSDTLAGFDPDVHSYVYDKLPAGSEMPTRAEIDFGTIDDEISKDKVKININNDLISFIVPAQDTTAVEQYYVTIRFTKDSIATLNVIEETFNGQTDTLKGFKPTTYKYFRELPIGTREFPEITFGDERFPGDGLYPSIEVVTDTVDSINMMKYFDAKVTAQNGNSNTYSITYRIPKSTNNTLQTIKVSKDGGLNWKVLDGFDPQKDEYYYELTSEEASALNGELPMLDWEPGDEFQTVDPDAPLQKRDSLSRKSLLYKHEIRVTAASGSSRTYTIHYPVELSKDSTLHSIKYSNGGSIEGFSSDKKNYRISIPAESSIPTLIPIKNNDAQRYEFDSIAGIDTVRIFVWAEDTMYRSKYTIAFERVLSTNATLRDIILKDTLTHKSLYDVFEFKTDSFDYEIILPYDSLNRDVLPLITPIQNDSLQTVRRVDEPFANGVKVSFLVTAANGEDEAEYTLRFNFTRNNDAALKNIYLVQGNDTVAIQGFKPTTMDYTYVHPFGSDSTAFFDVKNVYIVLSDTLANAKIENEDGALVITVVAQDGKTTNMYSIHQIIGKDTVNTLSMIYLDGVELEGFDPEETFYTYILMNGAGATPVVTGIPTSPNADTTYLRKEVNDTTLIFCTAQDGTDRIYRILFKESDINDGITATSSNEVFIRRVKGANQLFVSTIRSGVFFYLYDRNGHLVYQYENLPTANPNNVEVEKDGWDNDILLNVEPDPNSGIYVDIIPQQVYFYSFVSAKKKIASGKLIAIPAK